MTSHLETESKGCPASSGASGCIARSISANIRSITRTLVPLLERPKTSWGFSYFQRAARLRPANTSCSPRTAPLAARAPPLAAPVPPLAAC
ncbi:unnamed protein product [Closterium sp. NIES-54]